METEKPFNCEKCDKSFGSEATLYKHMKTYHKGERYSCKQCDWKPFESKMGLYNHIRSIHEEVRYLCEQCDWKGRQPYHLKQHIKTVRNWDAIKDNLIGVKTWAQREK